ncbi:TetR/AcrR family transcriptional regulator [Nocardia mexicana]|uniref:TetR/AcrR family transcriptional regulator n=1 Tax=Nocardia mexicana TaxID=279262 RepID=UPI001B87D6C8|nr:TetR/AcrR family transcriptional regulator C-terminal domain-containing protein [Nocardia mexicana]
MSEEPRVARSRRERPAKPALTRAGIVAAAVAVMDAEGLEKVTMRRLAAELDTGAASLYVYFRNAAELRAAVLDELLAAVDLSPAAAEGDWEDRLRQVLWSYVRVLMRYPPLADSALLTRPSGARYLDLVEAVLALLRAGGLDDRRAAWAVDVLLQFATATGAEQAAHDANPDDDAEQIALAAAVDSADAERYPRIRALGADLLSGPGEVRGGWGLSVLINGILATPRPDPE